MSLSVYEEIVDIVDTLAQYNEWYYVKNTKSHTILTKSHYELDRIDIEHNNNTIHFSLPLHNSQYSFYRKFIDTDHNAIDFFENYVSEQYDLLQ